mmetsp:Transcript_3863/g.8280  ORF Transcript_3863/g.8280 Transcript_3863/m.8280 type:complete len:97 (+) Transcript_3863:337-627(+)
MSSCRSHFLANHHPATKPHIYTTQKNPTKKSTKKARSTMHVIGAGATHKPTHRLQATALRPVCSSLRGPASSWAVKEPAAVPRLPPPYTNKIISQP